MNNGIGYGIHQKKPSQVDGIEVEVLSSLDSTAYLGTQLCLGDFMEKEIEFRMSRAWAKFCAFRAELTDKRYSLYDRLKVFNSVVTPCALYGSGSWVMTSHYENVVRTTQRRMLRAILGRGRMSIRKGSSSSECRSENDQHTSELEPNEALESWPDWLKRTTEQAMDALHKVGAKDWVMEQRHRKWQWAGKVVRCEPNRWTRKMLRWLPAKGARSVGQPKTRWRDALDNFAAHLPGMAGDKNAWIQLMSSSEVQQLLVTDFVMEGWL